jgi:hypothetical protein
VVGYGSSSRVNGLVTYNPLVDGWKRQEAYGLWEQWEEDQSEASRTSESNLILYINSLVRLSVMGRSGLGEVPWPVWLAHCAFCNPVWPAECTYKAKRRGGGRGPFLNCKTPLFQGIAHFALYSTIGIDPVMWVLAHNKNLKQGTEEGSVCNQCSQFFPFLGFRERGKGRNLFFFLLGVGVSSSIHGMEEQKCGNLSHSKEVVAKKDRPHVVPSSVIFYFIFLRFFVCSHSGDLP